MVGFITTLSSQASVIAFSRSGTPASVRSPFLIAQDTDVENAA